MLNLIFLFLDFTMFILSFVFIILDLKSYQHEKNEELKGTVITKRSRFALLFGLLALILAVIISLGYV
jgi:hypothetical protein